MSNTDRTLATVRAADAFRAHMGLSGWEEMSYHGWGNFHPTPGHRYLFHARSKSGELKRHGIHSLTLVVTYPASVYADIILEGGVVALIVRPDRVSIEIDMEPFGGLVYKTLSKDEIDEMRREWEPFRLAMDAVEEARAQLASEAKGEGE